MPTVLESLNHALHDAFAVDPRVYLIGQDVLDPYGGAFKVARGLSRAYPERVLTTPISEAAMIGLATGMALRGLHPVVEIMFGDFLTLAADQLINHAAKFRWMYNEQVRLPLVVRTPMGGRRGYGPTHSQTLEKHFLGVPGLEVLAASSFGDPGGLLKSAILESEDSVLFIENKLLYLSQLQAPGLSQDFEIRQRAPFTSERGSVQAPWYHVRVRGAPQAVLTVAAYGYMAELAQAALRRLAYEQEVFADLVVYTRLSPYDLQPLQESLESTRRLLTVEEGPYTLGWGAEILARATQMLGDSLRSAQRVAALDLPVPASGTLEQAVLPGVEDIMQAAKEML